MKTIVNTHWSISVRIITLITCIILLVTEITLISKFISSLNYSLLFVIISIAFICIVFIINAPISISFDSQRIIFKKLIGKFVINYHSIISIDRYYPSFSGDIRIFGSGGFFGYTGIFSNKDIGKYFSFVGDTNQAFLIKTSNGKQYVFSCENTDYVIETIKKKLYK